MELEEIKVIDAITNPNKIPATVANGLAIAMILSCVGSAVKASTGHITTAL
ncbi:hypothetical protein ITG09_09830 [Vibrio cyclitrophicus]|nr:hypothetical protein [Vibrio cyclitrophicus]UPR51014.1 hypothetical protein ITG09_09830 [Vibrio cyclitrophicus]